MNIYAETPRILRETTAGYTTFEVVDEMFHNRELECVGEINDQSVYSLCRVLSSWRLVSWTESALPPTPP